MLSNAQIMAEMAVYMEGSKNPDFLGYKEQALTRDRPSEERFTWDMRRICRLGNFYNGTILDVGCGCGWLSHIIAKIGRNHVIANDILPPMIDGVTDAVQYMKQRGLECNLTPMLGDVCDLDLPDGSIDGICSLESIEHVHDIDKMFDRCAALLRPGGRIVICNDNNIHARGLRDETVDMWHKRETSWEWIDYLRSLRPIEHGNAKPFKIMREEIVRDANPSLSPAAVSAIVDATKGQLKSEIARIAKNYPDVSLPTPPAYDWCRNPETGEYAERLLDPFDLADRLAKRGMKTKVYHSFRKMPLTLFNGVPFKPVNKLLFNIRSYFVVVGTKM
jgi:SAM-dependent methyltransferase